MKPFIKITSRLLLVLFISMSSNYCLQAQAQAANVVNDLIDLINLPPGDAKCFDLNYTAVTVRKRPRNANYEYAFAAYGSAQAKSSDDRKNLESAAKFKVSFSDRNHFSRSDQSEISVAIVPKNDGSVNVEVTLVSSGGYKVVYENATVAQHRHGYFITAINSDYRSTTNLCIAFNQTSCLH